MATVYENLTITISTGVDAENKDLVLEAELNDEDNESPSFYAPNEKYLFRLYRSPELVNLIRNQNFGNTGLESSGNQSSVSEQVVFTGSNESSTSKIIKSNFTYAAQGQVFTKAGVTTSATISGIAGTKKITADKEIYGVFDVTFVTEYEFYWFQASRVGTMLIFFIGSTAE